MLCDSPGTTGLVHSFIRLLLQAETQPTLYLSAETMCSLVCLPNAQGEEGKLIDVCNVCA